MKKEELIEKVINYLLNKLVEYNVGYYDQIEIFRKIGFSDKDLLDLNIRDIDFENEIEELED